MKVSIRRKDLTIFQLFDDDTGDLLGYAEAIGLEWFFHPKPGLDPRYAIGQTPVDAMEQWYAAWQRLEGRGYHGPA